MHICVEPFLYANIELHCRKHKNSPFQSFLQTILQNPKLACHVQRLVLRAVASTSEDFQTQSIPRIRTTDFDITQTEGVIRSTRLPHVESWVQALLIHEQRPDALVALLLSQLYAIKHLLLGSYFTQNTETIGLLFKYALLEAKDYCIPSFKSLKKVYYEPNEDIDPVMYNRHCHGDVLPLFYLPAMQTLTIQLEAPAPLRWPAELPSPSMLTYLNIDLVQETQLFQLLSVTKSLQVLRWCWYHDPPAVKPSPSDYASIDLILVTEALSLISETLTDLSIYGLCGQTDNIRPFNIRLEGSWNAMTKFDRLKRLEAPIPFFIGFRLVRDCRLQMSFQEI
jgi:hypothetical protein